MKSTFSSLKHILEEVDLYIAHFATCLAGPKKDSSKTKALQSQVEWSTVHTAEKKSSKVSRGYYSQKKK